MLLSLFLLPLLAQLSWCTQNLFGNNNNNNGAAQPDTVICSQTYQSVYATVYDTILVKKVRYSPTDVVQLYYIIA